MPVHRGFSVRLLTGKLTDEIQPFVRHILARARKEIREELSAATNALIQLAIVGGMLFIGGVMCVLMFVHILADLFRLPIGASYGIVGLVLIIVGSLMLFVVQRRLKTMQSVLPHTVKMIKENAEWISDRTKSNRT